MFEYDAVGLLGALRESLVILGMIATIRGSITISQYCTVWLPYATPAFYLPVVLSAGFADRVLSWLLALAIAWIGARQTAANAPS